jgi:hypothetical protein
MSEKLPRCVYLKHGSYYLVKGGKWHFLTKDKEGINEQLNLRFGFDQGLVPYGSAKSQRRSDIEAYVANVLARARQNAKGRGRILEFSITREDVISKLKQAKYRCAVTGTPLSLQVLSHDGRKPFAPSIDRIDNEKGYTADNCRVVCLAANIAMNTWGEGVLLTMLKYAKGLESIRQRVQNPILSKRQPSVSD